MTPSLPRYQYFATAALAASAFLGSGIYGFQVQQFNLQECKLKPLAMIATNNDGQTFETTASTKKNRKRNKNPSSQTTDSFLFQDDKGHINRELAHRIYKWEQNQRLKENLPKFQYSTRECLRWVLDCVPDGDEDLMQEGVIALMEAMTEFERKAPAHQSFETFAKQQIHHAVTESRYATSNIGGRGKDSQGRSVINTRKALSVETTVKIDDPLETHYSNQDEWEVREGLILNNGQQVKADQLVEDFLDETLQYEGEDQMWVHQQQVAAPLTHSIPDEASTIEQDLFLSDDENNANPDDRFLADMIRYDVDEFLGSTLEDLESQVIRMRFGLGKTQDSVASEPMTQKQVAFALNLSVTKVRKLQKQALEKLRNTYMDRYTSGEDDDHYWEDSV